MQLTATNTLQAIAGTTAVINYAIFGDRKTTSDSYEPIATGVLTNSVAILYTVPASTQILISSIALANQSASPVSGIIFYLNGSAATNKLIAGLTIPASGSATYSKGIWRVYGSDGLLLSTVGGAAGGGLFGSYPNPGVTVTPSGNTLGTGRTINTTAPITGGGDLSADRTLALTTSPAGQTPVGVTRAINTTAPITGGGDMSADRTIAISPATPSAAGSLSASDKKQLDDMWYDIVADGGADPLGVVDATSIISTAISTVAAAGGGIVFIPTGTYKVTSTITIAGNFVTVRGASRVASKLVPTFATGNIFTVSGIFNRFEYLRIEPASSTLRTAGYGIEFTSTASNCGCQWVDILFMWSAVKASGQLCRLEDMNIRECGYGAVNGCVILIDTFTDQYLSKIVCDNGTVAPNAPQATFAGIRITNLSSLLMSDCQIIHCQVGIDAAAASTNTIPSIYCMNTFFDNGTIGAKFTPGSGNIYRCRFMGVWFSSNSTAGVQLLGASINGLDFIGCEFYGNPIGIDAQAATEWAVRASRFAGNTANAIKTTAAAAHAFSISDNVIGNVSGFGANAQGINIQAGTYKRYQVLDNRGLESNTTPGIIDLGVVAAADQKNVANNMGTILKGAIATLAAPLSVPVTTETLVLNARIQANGISVGQVFRIRAVGVFLSTNVATWRVRVGTAGTVAGDATVAYVAAAAAQIVNSRGGCDLYVTIRSLGAPGSIEVDGMVHNHVAIASQIGVAATAAATTTADWFIDLSLAQTISSALIQHAFIEAL